MQARAKLHRPKRDGGRAAPLPALPWRPRRHSRGIGGGEGGRTVAARVGLSSKDNRAKEPPVSLHEPPSDEGAMGRRHGESEATGAVRRFVKSRIAKKVRGGRRGLALPRLSRDGVGLGLAALIFGAWAATLPLLFAQPERLMPCILPSWAPPGASTLAIMAARTWLTTGLFVTVHDAIHGQVAPSFKRVNHSLGALCAFCYASFSYKSLYVACPIHFNPPDRPPSTPTPGDQENFDRSGQTMEKYSE